MERTKLIAARARNHWTLAQAAERLQVDINTVYRWERGLATPRAYNLQRLCEVYGVVASELDLENRLMGKHPIRSDDGITTEELGFMAEPQTMKEEELTSRHGLLQPTRGILGTELLTVPQIQRYDAPIGSHLPEVSKASVTHLATITQQFRMMQRQGDAFITDGVNTHIQTVQAALESTIDDRIRRELWRVLAQTQIVAGFNPMKKAERGRAKTFLEAAIASAQMSGDALLMGATFGHLAHFSLREEQNMTRALQLLDRAHEFVYASHPLNGWFALVMASLTARRGQKQQCEAHLTDAIAVAHQLPQTPEYADIYFTDFSLLSTHIFTVNCLLVVGNAVKAYAHLNDFNIEELSDNRRASALYDASRACAMMSEFERAQQFAFQAIDKALLTQQYYVIARCMALAQTIQQKEPDKPYGSAIADYVRLALQYI